MAAEVSFEEFYHWYKENKVVQHGCVLGDIEHKHLTLYRRIQHSNYESPSQLTSDYYLLSSPFFATCSLAAEIQAGL